MNKTEMYEHRGAIRKIIKEYEEDFDVIDDLTQEVFAQAMESEWDGNSKLVTWLCAIAKNVGRMHVRTVQAQKRQGEVLECHIECDLDAEGYATPYYDRTDLSHDAAEAAEHLDPYYQYEAEQAVEQQYESLPRATQYPMRLRAEGYSNPEIAEMLSLSVSYVENLISRARKFLADGENLEVNTTNNICERDGAPLERYSSQEDVERAQRERFRRRDSAFVKRMIRARMPDASAAEWREAYEEAGV